MSVQPPVETPKAGSRSPFILPLLCLAQFMVVLDVSIVNLALPSIQKSLHVSQQDIQWVLIAYGLALGGFLLLGGRCADLLGRRRMLMFGAGLFTLSSLACGLSHAAGLLVAFRATQGLGAAFTAPAALSTLTTVFTEGAERNKALGIWGAIGGSGGAVGVLLGGTITNGIGWRWIFFLNVPIGALIVFLSPRVLPESKGYEQHQGFDAVGAVSVTGGLVLAVYAVNRSIDKGWGSGLVLGCLALAAVLLVAFVLRESRAKSPLLDLNIFRIRAVTVANSLALIVFGCVFSLFFITSLYMQQVLGYSALKTGLAYLPLALLTIFAATGASQAVTKIGPKWVLTVGLILLGGAMLVFSRAGTDAKYATNLLAGFVMAGLGLGLSVVPIQVSAFSGVDERESGLAAGLVNTAQELGGALMVAVLATVSFSRFNHFMASHGGDPTLVRTALDEGFKLAFTVAACLIALALIGALTLLVPRPHHPPANAHGVLRRFSPTPIHHHRWPHPHHGNGAGAAAAAPVTTETPKAAAGTDAPPGP